VPDLVEGGVAVVVGTEEGLKPVDCNPGSLQNLTVFIEAEEQLSRSFLLAPRAAVNVQPNLQLIAGDVKCSHGVASVSSKTNNFSIIKLVVLIREQVEVC
jgi:hypothetical protein